MVSRYRIVISILVRKWLVFPAAFSDILNKAEPSLKYRKILRLINKSLLRLNCVTSSGPAGQDHWGGLPVN
jgi:hypothetical protein